MNISECKYEAGWLMLKMPSSECSRFWWYFKPGEYEIKPAAKKRSQNANSYAWQLIGEISKKVSLPKNEVYQKMIEDIGGMSDVVTIKSEALYDFTRAFINGHLGRSVDPIGTHGEFTDVVITYGSSDYDTAQMSRFIDSIVQECHVLDIPTMEDARLDQIIKAWEADREK